jgi:CrcB protein
MVEAWPAQPGQWPWATFAVNVAGSALLGWVAARDRHRGLLGTGLCGALTTFSAFQLELVGLVEADRPLLGFGYAAGSIAAGLAAVTVAGRRRPA